MVVLCIKGSKQPRKTTKRVAGSQTMNVCYDVINNGPCSRQRLTRLTWQVAVSSSAGVLYREKGRTKHASTGVYWPLHSGDVLLQEVVSYDTSGGHERYRLGGNSADQHGATTA